jgi:hypothetical protein
LVREPDHQPPGFVGAKVNFVALRRLTRQLDRVFVFAGRQIERWAVQVLGNLQSFRGE